MRGSSCPWGIVVRIRVREPCVISVFFSMCSGVVLSLEGRQDDDAVHFKAFKGFSLWHAFS